MTKFNQVHWLHVSKISIFFMQLIYVSLLSTIFISLILKPSIPTNGLSYSLGAYTSDIVTNLIITNFRVNNYHIILLTLIAIFYVGYMTLAIINIKCFKFDNYKNIKLEYFNMLMYTIILILCFIFVLAKPNVSTIDFNTWLNQPQFSALLNVFYVINIKNKNIEYVFSTEGSIIMAIYLFMLFICIIVLLLIIKKVINHKYF